MGVFDSVMVECPECGHKVEHQSKADEMPYVNTYTVEDAPAHILIDCLNEPHRCGKCGTWHVLYDPAYPPNAEPPRPIPTVRRVRTPRPGEFSEHFQGFAWWEAPFTEADMLPEPSPATAKKG